VMTNVSSVLSRQGRRMLQIGVGLILVASLEGVAIPSLPVPRLGLSLHTLSYLQAVMLMTFGLVWPRLNLGVRAASIAWWTYLYSSFATLMAYLLAAIWGAGSTAIPLAAGTAHGTALQETVITVVLASGAPPFLISVALVLWGVRAVDTD
jgi:(hydroxyamino)benzene mutase